MQVVYRQSTGSSRTMIHVQDKLDRVIHMSGRLEGSLKFKEPTSSLTKLRIKSVHEIHLKES